MPNTYCHCAQHLLSVVVTEQVPINTNLSLSLLLRSCHSPLLFVLLCEFSPKPARDSLTKPARDCSLALSLSLTETST